MTLLYSHMLLLVLLQCIVQFKGKVNSYTKNDVLCLSQVLLL